MDAAEKLIQNHELSKKEYMELLKGWENPKVSRKLTEEAVRLRKQYYGDKVYTRGLIEFTNYCKNDCYYCGIRRGNRHAQRYRLSGEEILDCCENGYALGFRTFVLQGGEDPYYTDERMADIVRSIRRDYPDCAITLSIGEKSYESYKLFKEAGADRYLLRHETASEELYRRLHPEEMLLSHRKQCLYDLKALGYQVGAGFMVGSPGQKMEHLAEDLIFLKELQPQMVGIGPFIPHHETRFANETAGSVGLTLFLLSVIRIFFQRFFFRPQQPLERWTLWDGKRGLAAGANVVMPNLSPVKNRKQYDLYDNKICTGEEAAECRDCLEQRVLSTGYRLVAERGDALL